MPRVSEFRCYSNNKTVWIGDNVFYCSEANKRIISQFSDISMDADNFNKSEVTRLSKLFNPEFMDSADVYETAYDNSTIHYELLTDMRKNVILSIVSGLYFQWEKALRVWLEKEFWENFSSMKLTEKIWALKFDDLVELFLSLGWNIENEGFYKTLDACRCVVNAYKHGEGKAFTTIQAHYPQYISSPTQQPYDTGQFIDHNNLNVSEVQLKEFADAISEFWKTLPEQQTFNINQPPPKWLAPFIKRGEIRIRYPSRK